MARSAAELRKDAAQAREKIERKGALMLTAWIGAAEKLPPPDEREGVL